MISASARRVLIEGLDDWIPFLTVVGIVEDEDPHATEVALRVRVVEVVRELLERKLVLIGGVLPGKRPQGGFHAWTVATDRALSRIDDRLATGDPVKWEFCCWLSNTALGDEEVSRPSSDDAGQSP